MLSDVAGHVGPPIPSCMVKLVDVPDMNYFASDNQGEVCIKGPIVFRGYLNQPDKTAEALDEDGWLHTGDIGKWTEVSHCFELERNIVYNNGTGNKHM